MTTTLTAAVAALPQAEVRGADVELVDASHDSRQVGPGWLFCCVPGHQVDGHDFAADAVAAGASALLVERWLNLDVPQARVGSVRAAMGPAAAAVHEYPSDRLDVVGVTGTNGKTTTTYLLEAAFGAAARGTGVVGTVETRIHGRAQPGLRTTPEGTDLQRLFAQMHARGVDAVAMEVSSHGLDLRRVDGTRYAAAVFTNLSQDHLDWHGTMDAYFAAKARLFTPHLSERGIVWIDDDWGRQLARLATVPVATYGSSADADARLVAVDADLGGTRLRLAGPAVAGPRREVEVETPLLGAHNAANAAAAFLAARAVGVSVEAAATGIAACGGVPGRLERVAGAQPFTVLVDYAHTPDALAAVVAALRSLLASGARLHLVIGSGGDRDRGKRRPMGAVAARADRAILTSDNPRSEDPEQILDELAAGAHQHADNATVVREPDRRSAIAAALAEAADGDVVLIAGKGHETGQEFADHTVPFDDRLVAAELLAGISA